VSAPRRRGLVGRGYLPKGGVPAARVHNAEVRSRRAVVEPSSVVGPGAVGRARQRAVCSARSVAAVVGLSLVAAGVWAFDVYELVRLVEGR
jgi:hypothetical protein